MNRQVCIVGYHYSLNKGGCYGNSGMHQWHDAACKETRGASPGESRERLEEMRQGIVCLMWRTNVRSVMSSYEQLEHIAHETGNGKKRTPTVFLKGSGFSSLCFAGIVLLIGTVLAYSANEPCRLWKYIGFSRSLYMGFWTESFFSLLSIIPGIAAKPIDQSFKVGYQTQSLFRQAIIQLVAELGAIPFVLPDRQISVCVKVTVSIRLIHGYRFVNITEPHGSIGIWCD